MKKLLLFAVMAFALSSCTMRLVDFTTISSKNVDLNIDRSAGKVVEAKKTYFLGIGWNIKDALDMALESAGSDYDMLIDGVVRYGSYPFIATVSVEGTAVKTSDMRTEMGDQEFEAWLANASVTYDRDEEIINVEN